MSKPNQESGDVFDNVILFAVLLVVALCLWGIMTSGKQQPPSAPPPAATSR